MKHLRYERKDVEIVNGFHIERLKIGAAVYWSAIKVDSEGYVIVAFRGCPNKASAVSRAINYNA